MTVGHGPRDRAALGAALGDAGIGLLVDVRRFPGSRVNPDVRREELEQWVPALGIRYRWDARLGGSRSLPRDAPVADGWWTVTQFAAYAAHTRTAEFAAALDDLVTASGSATVAVMCSESVWWRCHRRLVADVVGLARDLPVRRLMPDGRLAPHRPAEGAVLGPDGLGRWPGRGVAGGRFPVPRHPGRGGWG